jgi:hypothetical protein
MLKGGFDDLKRTLNAFRKSRFESVCFKSIIDVIMDMNDDLKRASSTMGNIIQRVMKIGIIRRNLNYYE